MKQCPKCSCPEPPSLNFKNNIRYIAWHFRPQAFTIRVPFVHFSEAVKFFSIKINELKKKEGNSEPKQKNKISARRVHDGQLMYKWIWEVDKLVGCKINSLDNRGKATLF